MKEITLIHDENSKVILKIMNSSLSIIKIKNENDGSKNLYSYTHFNYELEQVSSIRYTLSKETTKSINYGFIAFSIILVITCIILFFFRYFLYGSLSLLLALIFLVFGLISKTSEQDSKYKLSILNNKNDSLFSVECNLEPEFVCEIIQDIRLAQINYSSNTVSDESLED